MENASEFQNEMFGKLFKEIKKRPVSVRSDALTMLTLDDENFTMLFNDPDNEIVGDDEDIDLCNDRARHLGLKI
mgnify:CR=1 FL=1